MKPGAAGHLARSVLSAAATSAEGAREERVDQAVAGLGRVADLFETEGGRLAADVLHSSRVPTPERKALGEELARSLDLPREVAMLVEALGSMRALGILRAVVVRASVLAGTFAEALRVEVTTAAPLPEGIATRIGATMEHILGRPVRVEVKEDPKLLAGVVVKAGDRVWDGSLRGRMARAKETLAAGDMAAAT